MRREREVFTLLLLPPVRRRRREVFPLALLLLLHPFGRRRREVLLRKIHEGEDSTGAPYHNLTPV